MTSSEYPQDNNAIDPDSLLQKRVLYQTDYGSYGEGIVTQHDLVTDIVVVMDIDDGSFWRGPEDLLEVIV
jgi:hypothetical protein